MERFRAAQGRIRPCLTRRLMRRMSSRLVSGLRSDASRVASHLSWRHPTRRAEKIMGAVSGMAVRDTAALVRVEEKHNLNRVSAWTSECEHGGPIVDRDFRPH